MTAADQQTPNSTRNHNCHSPCTYPGLETSLKIHGGIAVPEEPLPKSPSCQIKELEIACSCSNAPGIFAAKFAPQGLPKGSRI